MRNRIEDIDALLAHHPFGDSDYITEQLHICYKRRLGKVSEHLPAAAELLEALGRTDAYGQYRTFGDTVVRCAIQHAHARLEMGVEYGLPLQDCEEIYRETTRLLADGRYGPLGSGLVHRLSPAPRRGWIWSQDRPDTVLTRAFRHIVRENDYEEELCTPDADELAMLARGVRLLDELLPLASSGPLSHTHLIAVFPQAGLWKTRMSSSEFRVSGTIFLSRRLLTNPWTVAEHLLHESLHQQLYDFRRGHSLLSPDFDRADAPLIHSPWNRPDRTNNNYWDVHRALAAFHVYVHLALLAIAAEQRASDLEDVYGPVKMVGSRTALARAHYLGEQLRVHCPQELGPAGKQFVDWFTSILGLLDPFPPVPGSRVHLLFDRYWREAREVGTLSNAVRRPEILDLLTTLTGDEIRTARSVLTTMNGDHRNFDDSLASLSEADPVERFVSSRLLIAETILNGSPRKYKLSESDAADDAVTRMVEDSSAALMPVLAEDRGDSNRTGSVAPVPSPSA
ncbi:aKG-HExxH-type peptide beta-hydroxylase [Nocardia arizonensis]|uniref:aKG-HExxH-type peptide beta-hydroxylase n=1 Tax=Nocardia arizonensis TaxID=1141647 RepID=UPI0012E23DF7|nr:HEXXH motif-containing putative peptide modification protein [Nocardia arizonensis]